MTHSGNYAKDRLALELFSLLFGFIRQWTQIELVTDSPVNLAKTYFEIFPEDKQPMWTVSYKNIILMLIFLSMQFLLHAYDKNS